MDHERFYSSVVKSILLADESCSFASQRIFNTRYEAQIKSSTQQAIQKEYAKFGFDYFKERINSKACEKCTSRDSWPTKVKDESISQPRRKSSVSKKRPSFSGRHADRQRRARLSSTSSLLSSQASVTSSSFNPAVLYSSDAGTDTSSLFSEEVFHTGGSTASGTKISKSNSFPKSNKPDIIGDLHRKDLTVYKAASICVQHPVLVEKSGLTDLGTKEELMLHKSNRSISEILSHYLRVVFHPLSIEKHRQYQAMLSSSDKEALQKRTRLKLFAQLQMLERNENKYYAETNFQTRGDFVKWQADERNMIFALLDQSLPPDTSSSESKSSNSKCRCSDFKSLVTKILKHEVERSRSRTESVVAAISEDNVFDAGDTHDGVGSRGRLLPPKAHRLLGEFAVRYRISAVTRRVALLQCLKQCCDSSILAFGDFVVLQEMLMQLRHLSLLLNEENSLHVILRPELKSVLEITGELTERIKKLMCSFVSEWHPNKEQLTVALALLEQCCSFLTDHGAELDIGYPDCVQKWFECAIRNDYYKNRRSRHCDCDPFDGSQTALVLRAVSNAIDSVRSDESNGNQAIFAPYVQDFKLLTNSVLYDCALSDVHALDLVWKDSPKVVNDEMRAAVVLASKLAELEQVVFSAGYHPTLVDFDRSWRLMSFEHSFRWLDAVEAQLKKLILDCVKDDGPVTIKTAHLWIRDVQGSDSGSEIVDENGCVITRVEPDGSVRTDSRVASCDEEEDVQSQMSDQGRMRMNTIGPGSQIGRSEPMLVAESTLGRKSEMADVTTSEAGSDCSADTTFLCTHSSVDFVVLLNRFISWTADIVKALYRIPPQLESNHRLVSHLRTKKEKFSVAVFKIVSSAVAQYVDCLLNLDLCKFPVKQVERFVKKQKRKELRERGKNGTLTCCRHQLEKLSTCDDQIEEKTMLKSNACYSKMAKRIGNAALIRGGTKVIWDRLCVALDLPRILSPDDFASHTSLHLSSDENNELHSDNNEKSNGNNTLTSEVRRRTSTTSSNRSCDSDRELKATEPPTLELGQGADDEQSSSDEDQRDGVSKQPKETLVRQNERRRRESILRQNSVPLASFSGGRGVDVRPLSRSGTGRRRTLRKSISLAPYYNLSTVTTGLPLLMELMLDSHQDKVRGVTEASIRSLCGIWSWRVSHHISEKILEAFASFPYALELSKNTLHRDMVKCQEYCHALSDVLRRVLEKVTSWLQPDIVALVHTTLWEELTLSLKQCVQSLKDYEDRTCSRAFFLLMASRQLIRQFAEFKFFLPNDLADQQLAELQTLLSVLELYVMPSTQVVDAYREIEEKINLGDTARDVRLVRQLCRKRKSFTGSELTEEIKKLLPTKSDHSDRTYEALEFCRKMFDNHLIKIAFVRNSAKNHLPELVDCCETLTSSCESQIGYTSPIREQGLSKPRAATSSDISSLRDSDTDTDSVRHFSKFVDDGNHYYRFDIDDRDIHLYYFNDADGNDVGLDFLRHILTARRRRDQIAREFLRRKGYVYKWFSLCSCLR